MHAHEVRGWRVLATASMPLDAIVRRQPPPRPRALEMHRPAVLSICGLTRSRPTLQSDQTNAFRRPFLFLFSGSELNQFIAHPPASRYGGACSDMGSIRG